MIVIIASLSQAQIDAAKASYEKLTDVDQHVASKKPPKNAEKLNVTPRIRSASFGHSTMLHIAPDGSEFWVEFGKSTNKPGGLYGPCPVDTAPATPPAAAPSK